MASSTQDTTDRRKLALIIANDEYQQQANRLSDCVNNARELSKKLKAINFNVQSVYNLRSHQMTEEIIDFSRTIRDGDLVFFYFSGHGYQVDEKNYMMAVDDDRIEKDRDVVDFGTNVDNMFSRLAKKNPSYVTVFILDCCRPYALASRSRASCKSAY